MTARVQVVVEAKDEASGILRGITSQFGQFGSVIEEVTGTSINWGNVLAQAAGLVIDGLKASIQATQEYANEVRDLALISGTSAEEASRLIQVLDDFQLTAQDATVASRAMTRNGLAPTVETIAQLSDEYLSLNSAQERNQFLLENFGRSGAEWVNLLNKGGDAIIELNDGVAENLILTEESINNAEEYRLALDAWDDSVQALQLSIGTALLPTLTELINNVLDTTQAQQLAADAGLNWVTISYSQKQAFMEQAAAMREATTQAEGLTEATISANNAASRSPADINKQISAMRSLTQATQDQINATAYMLLQQQLAADGIISPEDYEILIDAGIAMGQFDEQSGNTYKTIGLLNQYLAEGRITLEMYAAAIEALPDYTEIEIHTIYTEEGTPPQLPGGTGSTSSSTPIPAFAPTDEYTYPTNRSTRAIEESGGSVNNFYAPVTLQVDASVLMDILEYR